MPLPPRWDRTFPLIRDNSKCIQCLRCVNVCDRMQSMKVWEFSGTGRGAHVSTRDGVDIHDINCALCGQCITHCPVGALSARDDTARVLSAIADPDKIVVVQIAPAVRAAWGDEVGLPPELATEKRMAAAVRSLGVDYVFDTNFSADLTIMEEGSELIEHLKTRKGNEAMFTSCCPGWVRFLKLEFPELVPQLSSAKSPQQMFGAVTKSYFADLIKVDPEKIFCVSVMPCSAKKYECDVEAVNDAAKDVDVVLTTRELGRLLRGTDVAALPEEEFDQPLGTASGAGVIFGATGGVMEAALRSAYYLLTGDNPDADAFSEVRGLQGSRKGWREYTFTVKDLPLKIAVATGLASARMLMTALKKGEVQYDFIEVMACPGGCAGGGGQPIRDGCELAGERGKRLYQLDRENPIRFSHENPSVQALYKDYLGAPLSEKAHHLLHTEQTAWKL